MNQSDACLRQLNERSPKWARNPIIAGLRGSHAHGTYISPEEEHGTDDTDVFGIVIRNPDYYIGLDGHGSVKKATFETAGEDLDIETHELRKFVSLLCKGNPNVHQHLWLKPEHYLVIRPAGRLLIHNRRMFVTARMFDSFGGYAYAQFKRMERPSKQGYMGEKRMRIVTKYGYDIKNAAHCLRLLYCGLHLAKTGEVLVWLPEERRLDVLAVKRGEKTLDEVRTLASDLFTQFHEAKEHSSLPTEPDRQSVNTLLRRVVSLNWDEMGIEI